MDDDVRERILSAQSWFEARRNAPAHVRALDVDQIRHSKAEAEAAEAAKAREARKRALRAFRPLPKVKAEAVTRARWVSTRGRWEADAGAYNAPSDRAALEAWGDAELARLDRIERDRRRELAKREVGKDAKDAAKAGYIGDADHLLRMRRYAATLRNGGTLTPKERMALRRFLRKNPGASI